MLKQALFYSFFSNYFSFILQFIAVLFIARLLTPEEMGVFGIAASFALFAQALRDFGVSQYIVQEDNLTDDRIQSAFSLSLIFGALLFSFTYYFASFAGEFYNNSGIEEVLKILSISFILLPFGAISLAYLRRKMNFKVRMIVDSSSAFVKVLITLVLAYNGFSYMSLAYGSLSGVFVTVLLSLYFRPKHLPEKPGFKELAHVFKTGWKLATVGFLSNLLDSVTEVILGKTVGVQATGYFSRAIATLNIFNVAIGNALKPIALPYFSQEKRKKESLGHLYLQALSLLTVFAWPFFAFLSINSLIVVRVLYGPQWDFSASLVSILCAVMALHTFSLFFDQLSIATGDSVDAIKMHGLSLFALVVLLIAFSPYGLKAVAFALFAIPIIRLLFVVYLLSTKLNTTFKEIMASIQQSIAVTLSVLITGIFYNVWVESQQNHEFYSLLISALIALLTWLISIFIFHHPIKKELLLIANKIKH